LDKINVENTLTQFHAVNTFGTNSWSPQNDLTRWIIPCSFPKRLAVDWPSLSITRAWRHMQNRFS